MKTISVLVNFIIQIPDDVPEADLYLDLNPSRTRTGYEGVEFMVDGVRVPYESVEFETVDVTPLQEIGP